MYSLINGTMYLLRNLKHILLFLTDPESVQWIKNNRVIFIMRGLPGSGKSTLVKSITEVFNDQIPVICSADHYFIDENGIYR